MKKINKLYIIILILIPIFLLSIIYKVKKQTNFEKNNEENMIKVNINKNNVVKEIDLEEYIIGVVAGEMPASFEKEALKAQSIASRTYAIYQMKQKENLEVTTDDQVYITKEEMKTKWQEEYDYYYNRIKTAVEETKGLIMTKNNKVFKSYYFAMSNGQTADSMTVFKENTLKSVKSHWDNETLNKFIVTKKFTKKELENKLKVNNINTIEIVSRDETNRVEKIKVNENTLTGIEFRTSLELRSTDFDIKYKENTYYITTKGYGHGVGMSQYGANGMAKEKHNYKEILKHYYQDIKIEEI